MKRLKTMVAWEQAISYDGVTLVDFYMNWCLPCQKLAPVLDELEKEYTSAGQKLKMVKIEVDDIPNLSRRFKVSAAPSLFLFIRGKESGTRMIGLKEKGVIKKRLDLELKKLN